MDQFSGPAGGVQLVLPCQPSPPSNSMHFEPLRDVTEIAASVVIDGEQEVQVV